MKIRSRNGPSTFTRLWWGQVVSLTGSGMTAFALGVWVYRETGSLTRFSLISLFAVLPGILCAPLAGAAADRFSRRTVVLLSDTGAALGTLAVALLYQQGMLAMWHIYLAAAVSSICGAFQWPAWLSVMTELTAHQRGRGNGMLQLGQAAAGLSAPLLAGTLGPKLGLQWIFVLDLLSFVVGCLALLGAGPLPQPQPGTREARRGLMGGLRFILSCKGLMWLLLFNMFSNFLMASVEVLGRPMILDGHSEAQLGRLLAVGGLGMVAGSLCMSVWGGPRCKLRGVVVFQAALGGVLVLIGFASSAAAYAVLIFAFYFMLPISTGSNLAIWQARVPDALRGRVFAAQRAFNWSMRPLAYAAAGPIVERLFMPLLQGPLSTAWLVRKGMTAGGISLMFVLMGAATMVLTTAGWWLPGLRRLRAVEEAAPA